MSEIDTVSTTTSDISTIAAEVAPQSSDVKAVVVAGTGRIPPGYALSVVCEGRTYETGEDGIIAGSSEVPAGYAARASAYLRITAGVSFPDGAPVATLGVTHEQDGLWGFTTQAGKLHVGPAHPAYAAANLAFQMGATAIDIVGLNDGEKERLKPYFDDLPSNAVAPAKVAVTLI